MSYCPQCAELLREVAALKADAERLDWLEKSGTWSILPPTESKPRWDIAGPLDREGFYKGFDGSTLRETIDAARSVATEDAK